MTLAKALDVLQVGFMSFFYALRYGQGIIGAVVMAFTDMGYVMAGLAALPWFAVFGTMIAIIAAVGAAVVTLTGTWNEVFAVLKGIANFIGSVFIGIWSLIKGAILDFWAAAKPIFDLLYQIVGTFLIGAFLALRVAAVAVFMVIFWTIQVVTAAVKVLWEVILSGIKVISGIAGLFSSMLPSVQAINGFFTNLVDTSKSFLDTITETAKILAYMAAHPLDAAFDPSGTMKTARMQAKLEMSRDKATATPQDTRSKLRVEPAQLIGIADAFKRVQTAATEDPEERYKKELLQNTGQMADNTKKLVDQGADKLPVGLQ